MNDLIGFTFFNTQDDFERWQIDNPQNTVCGVQPHAQSIKMAEAEKYKHDLDGSFQFGVFVTYRYKKSSDHVANEKQVQHHSV